MKLKIQPLPLSYQPYFKYSVATFGASLMAQMVKHLPAMQETWVESLGWKIPWVREWLPTPVFLPGKFHGQRNLVGYSPWGHKELDIWLNYCCNGQCGYRIFALFQKVLLDGTRWFRQ